MIGLSIGIGFTRFVGESGPPNPITGTGPTLGPLTDGDTLSDVVTWGSYSSTAGEIADPTTKQMRVDGGEWVTYAGSTEVSTGETWRIREIPSDGTNSRTFTSGSRVVQPIPPEYERTPFVALTRSIHSGHSLTDAYYYGNGWPGDLPRLRNSLLGPDDDGDGPYLKRSTVPGSSITYRWENDTTAKTDIDDFDALMITESGPLLHLVDTDPWLLEYVDASFDHFLRFCANTIENGAGNEVILWSIWPAWDMWDGEVADWDGISFTDALVEYGQYFETLAAFGTYKMHDLYTLPEGWKVWLIPGHRWWLRIVADLANSDVPTISTIDQLFDDDIHPDSRASYGLACFAFACLYQTDLREADSPYVLSGLDPDLRDYFWQIAWEIATDYAGVGMDGTSEDGSIWDVDTDPDFMPDWTLADPDAAPGWAIMIPPPVPENTVAPAITGTLEDGETLSLSEGTWTPTPDEVERQWLADASPVGSGSTLDLTGREGEAISARTRARMTGGDWSDWEAATGGGEVQPAPEPGGEIVVTSLGTDSATWANTPMSLTVDIGAADATKQIVAVITSDTWGTFSGTFAGVTASVDIAEQVPGGYNHTAILRAPLPSQSGSQTLSVTLGASWYASVEFFLVTGADETLVDAQGAIGDDYPAVLSTPIDAVADGAIIAGLCGWGGDPWTLVDYTVDGTNGIYDGNFRRSGYQEQTATGLTSVDISSASGNIGSVVAISLAPA